MESVTTISGHAGAAHTGDADFNASCHYKYARIDVPQIAINLDANDPLANVRDENNAVVIRGRATGDLTLTGKGAGALPTAAAVLSDVIEIGRRVPASRWASPGVQAHPSDYIIAVNRR